MIRLLILALGLGPAALQAETLLLQPVEITEWKSVFATVEARNEVPARARIGGTVAWLAVTEGDRVVAGAEIGAVEDQKLDFQLAAVEAQIAAAEAQLDNATAELARGEALVERGVSTAQRVDALRTQVDVVAGQILSLRAERSRITQTQTEGAVLAPADGIVLSVPVTAGEVVLPGENLATVGTGGFFLRLQLPERYAEGLATGATIEVVSGATATTGRLAKIYPRIVGGRVQADIEVEGLDARYAGARLAVRLPVGSRLALVVPQAALVHRAGLDFVTVAGPDAPRERVVLVGEALQGEDGPLIEILSGLVAGDTLVLP